MDESRDFPGKRDHVMRSCGVAEFAEFADLQAFSHNSEEEADWSEI
jgi:hypothetical protein